MDIEVDDDTFRGLTFVILSDGRWLKNNGSDFYIEFGGKKKIQKVTLCAVVSVVPLNRHILVDVTMVF